MNLAKRKMYTCYSNQSTVWHHSGYQSGCKILSVITEERNFVISLVVGQKVERKIHISKSGFNIKIIDKTTDNTELTVGILLNPNCIIINDENGFKLQEKEKFLTISSFTRGTESGGFINYRSNEVIETKSLRRTGPEVNTEINLPEFDNLNVHFFGSCPATPKYFRGPPNAGSINYFARNLSIKKIKLILVLSFSLVISGLLIKLIKN
jgi:hypothetical protein